MAESVFIEKSTGSLLIPSAAGFSPSANQTGLTTGGAFLQMMVQDFQNDSDWTIDSNIQLAANRTGRYRFSFLWAFSRTAGAVDDVFSVDLYINEITRIERTLVYANTTGTDTVSGCLVAAVDITAGDLVQTSISNITTNTYQFLSSIGQSSLLIERMR